MKKLLLLTVFGIFSLYGAEKNSEVVNSDEQNVTTIKEDTVGKKRFVAPDDEEFKKKIENMQSMGEVTEG